MRINPATTLSLALLCLSPTSLVAGQFGLFTYQVIGGATVTITDYPPSVYGPADIPAEIDGKPVTAIGARAFSDCPLLTGVSIPSSITSIGDDAFTDCGALTDVTLHCSIGSMGSHAFDQSGLTTLNIAADVTSLDLNGDGVTLLMAYALDLDPDLNLAGSLPVAQLTPATLRISYHHTSPGITHTVETSTDLQNWTTAGVNFANFRDLRFANVPRDAPRRFLRLTVED